MNGPATDASSRVSADESGRPALLATAADGLFSMECSRTASSVLECTTAQLSAQVFGPVAALLIVPSAPPMVGYVAASTGLYHVTGITPPVSALPKQAREPHSGRVRVRLALSAVTVSQLTFNATLALAYSAKLRYVAVTTVDRVAMYRGTALVSWEWATDLVSTSGGVYDAPVLLCPDNGRRMGQSERRFVNTAHKEDEDCAKRSGKGTIRVPSLTLTRPSNNLSICVAAFGRIRHGRDVVRGNGHCLEPSRALGRRHTRQRPQGV